MSRPQISSTGENPANFATKNGQIISASVTLLVLPTLFVALRVVSRYMSEAGFWVCSCLLAMLTLRRSQGVSGPDIY